MSEKNVPPGYSCWADFESDFDSMFKQAKALYDQGKNKQAAKIELKADRMLSRYNAAIKRGDL
jgi:hypothetical protein